MKNINIMKTLGKNQLKRKIAAVTMAGGQGTRLGHNGPKGTFDIGLESHKSLFEILCDRLKKEKKIWSYYSMVYNDK